MRVAGLTDAEIARGLDMSEKTIAPYLYKAGKNGWLKSEDPRDLLEYQMMHKVVQRLDEALDDDTRAYASGMPVKTTVALKVAEGTMFKKISGEGEAKPPSVAIAIQIQGMPMAGAPNVDASQVGGTPIYVDGEVADAKLERE